MLRPRRRAWTSLDGADVLPFVLSSLSVSTTRTPANNIISRQTFLRETRNPPAGFKKLFNKQFYRREHQRLDIASIPEHLFIVS